MLVCAFFAQLHTRPRVQRASGLPCALSSSGGRKSKQTSDTSCRENAELYLLAAGKLNLGLTTSLRANGSSGAHSREPLARHDGGWNCALFQRPDFAEIF